MNLNILDIKVHWRRMHAAINVRVSIKLFNLIASQIYYFFHLKFLYAKQQNFGQKIRAGVVKINWSTCNQLLCF